MGKRVFWIAFAAILVFGFVLRVLPALNHNFFFTMDQADDGVYVREILERHKLVFHGARTNIPGVYAGPLWYYFLAVGYFFTGGDPFGGVLMVILLNVALTGLLMWVVYKKVGKVEALALGGALQVYWWFYDTSRFAFNPFPLVACAVSTVILLSLFLGAWRKGFFLAAIPVALGFNFEVAGATSLLIFYTLFSIYYFLKKKISWKGLVFSLALPAVPAGILFLQLAKRFIANRQGAVLPGVETNYFAGTNFQYLAGKFTELLSYSVIPYQYVPSLIIFIGLLFWFLKKENKNKFVEHFVLLTVALGFTAFLFFGSNRGWYDWHTLYLPVLFFVSFTLLVLQFPKKSRYLVLFCFVLLFQFPIFTKRYAQYLRDYKDPGILATELKVIDWIYQTRENDGFKAYTYMPDRRDYPYQYLFWWWGRKKHGFVPCEYSIYPKDMKLYLPERDFYTKPSLGCSQFVYLIVEPYKDTLHFAKWYEEVSRGSNLVEETEIAGVRVEKRRL